MRSAEISLAIGLPPGFGRDISRGKPVDIGVWVDGANPQRAETVAGYLQGLHQSWLVDTARHRLGQEASSVTAQHASVWFAAGTGYSSPGNAFGWHHAP